MDPYTFNVNTARELQLRRHIREILLPYARTHITSDYAAFTDKVVEELLLQTLEYVPMADTSSFFLPTEPFEALMHSLHALDFSVPEERWVTSAEHARYLRTFFRTFFSPLPQTQNLLTERCWLEDDHYARLSLLCRPMSPILSDCARRKTPVLGTAGSQALVPQTCPALTEFLGLQPVSVPDVQDLPAPSLEDVLDLHLKLDSVAFARLRPFLQSVLLSSMKENSLDCSESVPRVTAFLKCDSPPQCISRLESPPLFPRVVQGHSIQMDAKSEVKMHARHPAYISDLTSILEVASPELIDGEDGDINDHHMAIVNGWTTLTFSSPPPPSFHSSDGSAVDELWEVSPPGTPATSSIAAKMDEVEIPRIRKFGHKNTLIDEGANDGDAAALLTVANSPGFFITSFISAPFPMTQTQKPITSQQEVVKFGTHPPCPLSPGQSTSNSMHGQPPSLPEEQVSDQTSTSPSGRIKGFEELRFDDAVVNIYISTPQDPLSLIMEEKLDDKDIMLMEVPSLPPPTTHPKDPSLFSQGLKIFVALKQELVDSEVREIGGFGLTAFLRPVKGIKPLALDLSWRPFNFGKTIPTDEEIAGIAKPIQQVNDVLGYHDEKYEKIGSVFLDLSLLPTLAEDTQLTIIPELPRGCGEFGMSPVPKEAEEGEHAEYLLTQLERTRASGTKLKPEAEIEARNDAGTGQEITSWSYNDGHGFITAQPDSLHHEGLQDSQDLFYRTENGFRSGIDHAYSLDDTGIEAIKNLDQVSTSQFGLPLLLSCDDLPNDVDTPAAHRENTDDRGENKENVPPTDVGDYNVVGSQPDFPESQYDWSHYFEFPESEAFEPLSFASQSQPPAPLDGHANSLVQVASPLTSNGRHGKHPADHTVSASEYEQTNQRETKRRKLDDLVPASSRDMFSAFIGLRNQAISSRALEYSEARNDTPMHQTLDVPEQILPRATPDDVFDQHTVRLPEPWIPPAVVHRYLASMTLIQKRALVRELQGHHCRVDLVERYDLGGADIIIDPDSGVLFTPLLALPAHLDSTIERISRESWRYLTLLVVLEAFPSAQSYRVDCPGGSRLTPCPYTPPICKAIKKLRRTLAISEGCGTMNPRCTIIWAFANDVQEAAKFVRCFGEEACSMSRERGTRVLWDEREWLEEEEREGEPDLAGVHGMNAFAAFIMLYDNTLETILDLTPEVRLTKFGQLLGDERVTLLNAVIESRMEQIAPDLAVSVVDPGR